MASSNNQSVTSAPSPAPAPAPASWNPFLLHGRPFFEDKNRAFWTLQSIGWAGYFVLRTLSGVANAMGWAYVLHTALLTATGYSLTLLMAAAFRRLIRATPIYTWIGSIAIVIFAAAGFSAIETWSVHLIQPGPEGGDRFMGDPADVRCLAGRRLLQHHFSCARGQAIGCCGGKPGPTPSGRCVTAQSAFLQHAQFIRPWSLNRRARHAMRRGLPISEI